MVWIQAGLVGAFIFGLVALIIMSAACGVTMIFDPIVQAIRIIFNEFWTNTNDFHNPGSVIAAFIYVILHLAGLGITLVGVCVHGLLSSGVQRVLQSLEKQLLGQVQDIRDIPWDQPAPEVSLGSSGSFFKMWQSFLSSENAEDEDEDF